MPITNNLGQTKVGVRTGVLTQQASYLLDTYSGAAAAYSLRKLNGSYTGSAIRVRRSNDNTTLDVGFDASGNLDTTSLLSFVGGVNQIQYSEEFDNAYWGKVGVTVTANNTTAPDGTMTADLITETVSNSYHVFGRIGASGTWASGTSYNTSVYIKRTTDVNSPTRVALAFDYGTSALRPYVIFNIENGTVESYNFFTDINTGYSITDSGNGWWRISMWGTLTVSRSSFESGGLIRFNNNLSTISTAQYTPLSGSGVYLWGYQLTKLGTNLQPYSKTTTLTAGNGFISIWYDQSGNGRNATQEASANQPQIINNGVVYTLNSKPTIYFIGNQWLTTTQTVVNTGNSTYSIFGVGKHTSTSSRTLFFIGTANGGQGIGLNLHNNSTPRHYWFSNDFDSTQSFYNITSLFTISYDGTKRYTTINNVEQSSNSTGKATLNPILTIGRLTNNAQYMIGYESELFIYNSNKENDKTNIATSINNYYSIY